MRLAFVDYFQWNRLLLVAALGIGLGGCGGSSELPLGKVKGKVTYKGAPVTGGLITFSPTGGGDGGKEPGKAGAGQVGSDGSFTITTYKENDGAVVGRHRVTYQAPAVDTNFDPEKPLGPNESPPQSPFAGKRPTPDEVEVKAGTNDITIDLVDPM